MRVITQEKLLELLGNIEIACQGLEPGLKKELTITSMKITIQSLIDDYLIEIDTLTVSKLRPMSGAPRDGTSFLGGFDNDKGRLYECAFDSMGNVWIGELFYKPDRLLGWVPMPIYAPGEE
jgi:hypothetical protein